MRMIGIHHMRMMDSHHMMEGRGNRWLKIQPPPGEEGRDGVAQVSFDSFLPPFITNCLTGRIMNNRHGDKNVWISVILNKKNPQIGTFPVDFEFAQK